MTYLYGGVALFVAFLVLVVNVQHRHVASLQHDMAILQASLDQAVAANQAQAVTIDTCQNANRGFAAAFKVQAGHYTDALANLSQANAARDALELRLLKAQAADKLLPACNALLSMNIAEICPATEAAIRARAK